MGCGCLGLVLGLLLVVGIAMSGRLVNWFLDTTRHAIFEALPADVSERERLELERSFDRFSAALESGELNTRGITQLQLELTNAYSRAQNGALEPVDIQRLLDAFERVLPAPSNSPSAKPDDSGRPKVTLPDLTEGARRLPVARLPVARFAVWPAVG